MKKVVAMGELLIDFIPKQKGVSLSDVTEFTRMPGGAPANVVATVSKLGGHSGFIGQVGKDAFGDFLIDTLNKVNVDTTFLYQSDLAKTALAFVSLKLDGQREFIFYREPSADQLFTSAQLNPEALDHVIFHFCSVSLSEHPVKQAHLDAIHIVKKQGGFVSFDPNIRLSLFKDHQAYKEVIKTVIPYADLLKISDDELEFITGIKDPSKAIQSLFIGDVKSIILTKGSQGVECFTKTNHYYVPGVKVDVKDTTGAGDAFIGAFLYQLSKDEITKDNQDEKYIQYLKFANAAAALTTTKFGAISALPSLLEINELISK
ncbi:MAG: carbohydrate kinase [Firmicutes bacterium]|nr:carbohydrate kinase [Bacillota bacterium]